MAAAYHAQRDADDDGGGVGGVGGVGPGDLEMGGPPQGVAVSAGPSPSGSSSADVTLGGRGGHALRRVYHVVSFLVAPWLWYWHGGAMASALGTREDRLLGACGLLAVLLEAARLWRGFVCLGCRTYEARQVSAMAWGAVGAVLVLMMAPARGTSPADRAFVAAPIMWCLGLVDPALGELKAAGVSLRARSAAAAALATAVWAVSAALLAPGSAFAWALVPLMGPLAVAAEYPSIPSVDDNGLMLLVPLAVATMLFPWAD